MEHAYVVKCEACGDWRLLPQEMVRSLAYSRAIKTEMSKMARLSGKREAYQYAIDRLKELL